MCGAISGLRPTCQAPRSSELLRASQCLNLQQSRAILSDYLIDQWLSVARHALETLQVRRPMAGAHCFFQQFVVPVYELLLAALSSMAEFHIRAAISAILGNCSTGSKRRAKAFELLQSATRTRD